MGLFDSIVAGIGERAGLGSERASGLLAALLAIIADPKGGGFAGFIDKFRNAGLGDLVNSWISTGANQPLTDQQVETALGPNTIDSISQRSGIERSTATGALGGLIPSVVDALTPDGKVPDEQTLLSRIGGFLSEWGGAVGGAVAGGVGAASAAATGAADRVSNAAGNIGDRVTGAGERRSAVASDSDPGGSVLKWLLPLLLLLGLIVLGYWFCSRSTAPTNANVNVNANRMNANVNRAAVNANANVANTNANANPGNANTASRSMTEVTLPNGTKLQAFAGGIEDQLVKFIQSDAYKNGTNDQLKDKWFNFDDLNFVFGKTELTPESKRQLDNIAAILKAFPDAKIKIGGYTDKKGDDAANLKLSDSRAKAVQAALQKAGVGAQVPEAEGYGEQFATVDENASDEARQVDRKTAVRLIKS
jgi:outer membrane protein OmpA-like peptidoglycan-associated protein/uncharacterized protein YidB (DUF937 family)